ncbi:hypothetical protein PO909_016837 [Leuciscus waleckii]
MSPTKQAKSQGNSGKEPKLYQGDRMDKKNLGRNQAQSGGNSPLANERTVYDYDSGSITGQKSDWIRTFRILYSFIWWEVRVITPVWRRVC